MSGYLLGIVILLFICLLFFRSKEGFMDSDVMAIQTDITQQKSVIDKHFDAMNMLLKIDPSKNPSEAFDVEPILKKIIQKLKDLDKDKKEENVAIMNQLKALRQKIETMPPMIEKYRTEVKKFSNSKIDEMPVNQFLPSTQQFMEGLKADIAKILKD
jgi:hypothetical protein